nr:MAG TPA: hypothetical protein [Caudoviricetes sp.]
MGKILLGVLPFFHIDIEYNSEKEKEFYVNKFNELTSLGEATAIASFSMAVLGMVIYHV